MTSSRKYDIPEELRSANLECQRLRKKGLPVPDDVAAKNREYHRICRRGRGVQPRRRKHDVPEDIRRAVSTYSLLHKKGLPVPDEILAACRSYWRLLSQGRYARSRRTKLRGIPTRIRQAANEYRRLHRAGKPVPDGVLADCREYQRLLRRKRGAKPLRKLTYIPEDLRKAASEYRRLLKDDKPVPDGIRAAVREYDRLRRRARGVQPRRRKYDIPEELRKAASEYQRLHRAGKPVPEDVMDGCRKCRRAYGGHGDGPRGRRPERGDIPAHLRAAARECSRLRRRGLPIPDGLRELAREYGRAARRGRKPDGGPRGRRPVHEGIPARLRQANSAYHRLHRKGEPVPEEVMKDVREYGRLRRKAREGRA